MKWRDGKPADISFLGLALFSILMFVLAERTAEPERQAYFDKKLKAAKLALLGREAIKNYSQNLGVKIDQQNDPYRTGIVGQEQTLITSDRGIISSKIASTNPNFAAAFVDMLTKAKVKKNSIVAVGMTGSFPGWNLSFLAACQALELQPMIITSVGSSDWGANLPALTWLDMERVLNEKGVLPFKSLAASVGGGADNGRGLSPEGRNLIKQAIERNKITFIDEPTLERNISTRMEMYQKEANGKLIACYVNIGGGVASLGGSQNARLIPPGLTMHLNVKNYPVRGVINQMAENGLPVINLLNVEKIAEKYHIPIEVTDTEPELGDGQIFFKDRYSVTSTLILTLILAVVLFAFIRLDVQHYLFRKKSNVSQLEPMEEL